MKKIYLIFFCIFSLVVVYALLRLKKCHNIGCLDFSGISKYKLSETYRMTPSVFSGLFVNDGKLLRVNIENLGNNVSADKIIRDYSKRIMALYDNAFSPYPGDVSNEIVCDKDIRPINLANNNRDLDIEIIQGYLNSNMVWGVCQKNLIKYKVLLYIFYCQKQQKLYQMEIIEKESDNILKIPNEDPNISDTIKCL